MQLNFKSASWGAQLYGIFHPGAVFARTFLCSTAAVCTASGFHAGSYVRHRLSPQEASVTAARFATEHFPGKF